MQTLVFLAERQGEVVSRAQFFDAVWEGLVVNEEALSRAISLLRSILDDNAHRPKYIQTIPGVGYRLIAGVVNTHSPKLSAAPVKGAQESSIAVLPFVNLSDDPGNEYFSEGISEEILNVLAQVDHFKVVGRTSSFAFKGRNEDLREIGRALGVSHVLEGSVRKAGAQVRITAQLIEADGGYHLWSETFDRELHDIFAVQDEIAEAVAVQLRLALLPATPKVTETNPEAYALYLQSRYLERQSTTAGFKKALALVQEALSIAPNYAAAWNLLASIYSNMAGKAVLPPAEGLGLAREATGQALKINPDYASAHGRLGWLAVHFDTDFVAAARHYQNALSLAPTDLEIIGSAANLARSLGQLDQAIALQKYANTHDPMNPVSHTLLGFLYRCAGQYGLAISSYRIALRLSPGILSAQYNIGAALLLQGHLQAALDETLKEESEGYRLMGLAPIYHSLGQAEKSDAAMAEMIEKYEVDGSYNIAFMLAWRGETDRAFEWLEIALANQDSGLTQIINEPLIANLHGDPRWQPFLEKIGMSVDQLAAISFDVTLPS